MFADLYTQFVEPHLTTSRDNWDNLSHGQEYSQKIQDEAMLARKKVQEAEERKKKLEEEKKQKEAAAKKKIEDDKRKLESERLAKQKKQAKEKEMAAMGGKGNGTALPTGPKKGTNAVGGGSKPGGTAGTDEISKAIAAEKAKLALEDAEAEEDTDVEAKRLVRRDMKREMTIEDEAKRSENNAPAEMPASDSLEKRAEKDKEPVDRTTKYTESEKHAHVSFEKCGQVCDEDEDCFQWVFYEKTCKLGKSFRLGKYMPPKEGGEVVWKSGWNVDRIRKWTEDNACDDPEWPDL